MRTGGDDTGQRLPAVGARCLEREMLTVEVFVDRGDGYSALEKAQLAQLRRRVCGVEMGRAGPQGDGKRGGVDQLVLCRTTLAERPGTAVGAQRLAAGYGADDERLKLAGNLVVCIYLTNDIARNVDVCEGMDVVISTLVLSFAWRAYKTRTTRAHL